MEAIGRFTGGVAHDFNNLLMAVLSSLELLRKRMPPDERLRALVETATRGAQRGASLTQRMMAFARQQELKTQAVDVAGGGVGPARPPAPGGRPAHLFPKGPGP